MFLETTKLKVQTERDDPGNPQRIVSVTQARVFITIAAEQDGQLRYTIEQYWFATACVSQPNESSKFVIKLKR